MRGWSCDAYYMGKLRDVRILNACRPYEASLFETTIRVVGGMLAAYELSNDYMYIERSAHKPQHQHALCVCVCVCVCHSY